MLVLVQYELPNGMTGQALLNTNHEASGTVSWPFPSNCTDSGAVTLRFYDAVRGNGEDALLDTITFTYKYQPPEEEPTSEGENGERTDPTEPAGEASPGTGGGG